MAVGTVNQHAGGTMEVALFSRPRLVAPAAFVASGAHPVQQWPCFTDADASAMKPTRAGAASLNSTTCRLRAHGT